MRVVRIGLRTFLCRVGVLESQDKLKISLGCGVAWLSSLIVLLTLTKT